MVISLIKIMMCILIGIFLNLLFTRRRQGMKSFLMVLLFTLAVAGVLGFMYLAVCLGVLFFAWCFGFIFSFKLALGIFVIMIIFMIILCVFN